MALLTSLIKGRMGDIDPRYDPRKESIERNANLTPGVESRGTLDNVPRVSLSSLEGKPFITTMSDRTRAGGLLTDINGVPLNAPVNLQGGQDFMFENPGMVWASAPGVVSQIMTLARKQGEDPFYLPFRMAPTGGDFAKKTGEAMIQFASANMSPADKKALDKAIKEYVTVGTMKKNKKTGESKRVGDGLSMKGWKGVDDPASIEAWRNTPDSVRKELMQKVFDVQFRNRGGLSLGEARLAVSDPSQVGARDAGVQSVGKIWTKDDVVKDSGHPSYPHGVPGEGVGRLDQQDLTIFDLIPDARLGKKQIRVGDKVDPLNPTPRNIRAVSMKPYAGRIDEDILRKLEARGVNINSLMMPPGMMETLSYSDERAKKNADRNIPDARTIEEQRIANHQREVNKRMAELGMLEDPMYEYSDFVKTNIASGETSFTTPSFIRGMLRSLLDIGTTPRTGVYNPAAAIDLL